MTDAESVPCRQLNCTGVLQDGYCNRCGLPRVDPMHQLEPIPVLPASVVSESEGTGPNNHNQLGHGQFNSQGSIHQGQHHQALSSRDVPVYAPPVPYADEAAAPSAPTRVTGSSSLEIAPMGSARTAGTGVTRRTTRTAGRLRGSSLGAGITHVAPVAERNPEQDIMAQPRVPEERRFCPNCNSPVGRSRGGHPGLDEGYCPQCRTPFSFSPRLQPGAIVAEQYQVVGCLAHGGLGWVYLARDQVLSGRWVVLKGLLNIGDPDAHASAVSEREFLAQVEHPQILQIFNFVQHEGFGYIVMEYVGGTSLKDLLKQRMRDAGGSYDPFGVDQALAYLIAIMPAFAYLHDKGLLYCDFKPDNLIQVGDSVKLIDLGGVRSMSDVESPIYGTVGYQAPEIATVGPSVASDIYTIGRTLAVLIMEFRGYQSTYATSLPPLADVPVFQRYDSLYRLITKACAVDPADRFDSVDELRVQMLGVLREVVVVDAGANVTAATLATPSLYFHSPTASNDEFDWQQLPELIADPGDPMSAWLATLTVSDLRERLHVLQTQTDTTLAVLEAVADAAIRAGQYDVAETTIAQVLGQDPWEWQAMWLTGVLALAQGDATSARGAFNAVYGQIPGELAPKAALALACERSGAFEVAESLYRTCALTDAAYTSVGAFGLSRVRRAQGDVDGALAALDMIPATNQAYPAARRLQAGLLADSQRGLGDLVAALDAVEHVGLDQAIRSRLEVDVWQKTLVTVQRDGAQPAVLVGGVPAQDGPLRDAIEGSYRRLAQWETEPEQRIRYVDAANKLRRWTWT